MLDRNHTVFAAVFQDGSVHFNVKLTVIGMHDANLIVVDTVDDGLVIWKSRWPVTSSQLSTLGAFALITDVSADARKRWRLVSDKRRPSQNELIAS
jgi:hypothetical protein